MNPRCSARYMNGLRVKCLLNQVLQVCIRGMRLFLRQRYKRLPPPATEKVSRMPLQIQAAAFRRILVPGNIKNVLQITNKYFTTEL